MISPSRATPLDQAVRVNILRLAFVCALPLTVFTRSTWGQGVSDTLEVIGIGLVVAAVLGRFWSILYIGGRKDRMIMQDGPYSICRHPLYLFSTVGVLGFGMMLGSMVLTALLGAMTLAILAITAKKEEAFLRRQFGPAYDDYAARVPMILPRLSGFRTEPTITVSVAHLRQNLMDALVFLCFIPLTVILQHVKDAELVSTVPIW